MNNMNQKLCNKCGIEFPFINFYKNKSKIDSYFNGCKLCRKKYAANYYENNKIKLRKQNNDRIKQNKEANLIRVRNYRKRNKIRLKEKYLNSCFEISSRAHLYYEKNKDYIKKQNQIYINKRIKQDINFAIKRNLRSRLNQIIRNKIKSGSAIRDLGCTIDELKKHLESKFTEGMNWNNYGFRGWHIDHIKPLSKFNLSDREQLLEACHYTNLQPLWWRDNLAKGNKIIHGKYYAQG